MHPNKSQKQQQNKKKCKNEAVLQEINTAIAKTFYRMDTKPKHSITRQMKQKKVSQKQEENQSIETKHRNNKDDSQTKMFKTVIKMLKF